MSEAIIFENMPYNLFLKQRMEFVVICGDHLAANVMRVVEAEMIKRKEAWQVRVEQALEAKKEPPKEQKTWWVRLSQAQIIARLYMYDSAKLKKPESEDLNSPEWVEYRFKRALSISKATLKKAIELLKELGFLLERSKPGDEFGAPIYTLNKEKVQAAIKKLPSNPFAIFHHLGGVENIDSGGDIKNFTVPPKNSDSGDSKNLTVPPEEFSPGESQNFHVDIDITIDPPEDIEIDTEEESTYSEQGNTATTDANASTHAPVQDEPYRPDFTASQPRSEQDSVAPENETHSQLSTRAVDKPRQHGAKVASSETASQAALMDAPMVEKPAKARTSSRKKASAPAAPPEKPVYPAADATWNTTTCLALFDFWRGAPLLRKHECMEASHCAKGLAENYTRKQVETVRRWMVERDPYWSQRASGVDICQVASHIHRMLADIKAARVAKQKESASPPEMSTIELLRAEKMRYAQGGIQA